MAGEGGSVTLSGRSASIRWTGRKNGGALVAFLYKFKALPLGRNDPILGVMPVPAVRQVLDLKSRMAPVAATSGQEGTSLLRSTANGIASELQTNPRRKRPC